jgi:hypothetical protein
MFDVHRGGIVKPPMNRKQRVFALVVVLAFLAAGTTWTAMRLAHSSGRPLTTTPTCLTGRGSFCTGVALKEVSTPAISGFTSATGVFPSIVEYYQTFGKSFSRVSAIRVATVGARPLIQLNPHKISMAAIEAGQYDTYLRNYAMAVKAFGHTVMLSFGHEMNGDWSSWSMPFTKPADFVGAWRHIHDLFARLHVKNVVWSWDISHSGSGKPPKLWWPGASYVDWIGIDGYLRPNQTFAGQFWRAINNVRKLGPRKPVFIAETAVAPSRSQTAQIASLFQGARQRRLAALVWFNVNRKAAWQLTKNSTAASAFRAGAEQAMSSPSPEGGP